MENKDIFNGLKEEGNTDHDGVHSIAGKENNDSVRAPTTEASTSLSCSSADIYEQSTSHSDSSDMGFNVNAGAAMDVDGPETSTDPIELSSGGSSQLFSRKRAQSDSRNRETFDASSDDEDLAETEIKHAKTTDVQVSVDIISCENVSEPLATENERSEIGFECFSTSDNVRLVVGAECSIRLEQFELATTAAPSSGNEEDTAIRAVDENDTPPVNHGSDREDESAAEGEGSPARPSPENANLIINHNNTSEDADTSFIRNLDHRFRDLSNEWFFSNGSGDDSDTDDVMLDSISQTVQNVLNKPKPAYTWNSINELRRREHGLCGTGRYSSFNTRFYSSRHVVERMKMSHRLHKHSGCVNCLNFNRSGDLLCSGSDDANVVVWDWAKNKMKLSYESGHKHNVLETKFIEGSNAQGFDIISSGLDRQLRYAVIPPSGGQVKTRCLYEHEGPVHKFVICPRSPREIISVGEDGVIQQYDLRRKTSTLLQIVRADGKMLQLFGISHHPFKPEIVVCGCDNRVRVFDIRHLNEAVYEMCPMHLLESKRSQVTSCVYNSTGSEVLASYGGEDIYLFNNGAYEKGQFLHQYRGHINNQTIKGVNFFGMDAEYVISGSDCGRLYFWQKNTEAILNCMPCDAMGVVNCLETHPAVPILATSGLDPSVKIWAPISECYPPDLSMLPRRLRRNLRKSRADEGTAVENCRLQFILRHLLGLSGR